MHLQDIIIKVNQCTFKMLIVTKQERSTFQIGSVKSHIMVIRLDICILYDLVLISLKVLFVRLFLVFVQFIYPFLFVQHDALVLLYSLFSPCSKTKTEKVWSLGAFLSNSDVMCIDCKNDSMGRNMCGRKRNIPVLYKIHE